MLNIDLIHPKGIVWLASYPKSGNTWVRAFLFALEKICAGQEMSAIKLDEMVYWGETDRDVDYFARHLSGPAIIADQKLIAAARALVQRDIAFGSPRLVYIKTHNAMVIDRGTPTINPVATAGAIYLVRNPLDVAISWARFRGIPIDDAIADMGRAGFETATNEHDIYIVYGSWSENVRSWTERPNPAVLVVRYEDMLAAPNDAFAKIAAHLMIFANRAQTDQAAELSSFSRLQAAEAAGGFLEKPPDAERFFREGRAGQWRDVLTPAQVSRIVADHGEQMARFSYLP